MRGPIAFLDEIMLPYTCSDVQGLDPGSTGLRFKEVPSHRKKIKNKWLKKGGFHRDKHRLIPSPSLLSIQQSPKFTTHSGFRPVCDRVVQSGEVTACQASPSVNHNILQNPCCGSRDLGASCTTPSRCVYQRARSCPGRCNIQRLCMHMQYLSAHEDRFFSSRTPPPSSTLIVPRRSSPDDGGPAPPK